MYFEKIYKVNDNGKLSGYHKRGKYEPDGSIKYFINDTYGDQEALKHNPASAQKLKGSSDSSVEQSKQPDQPPKESQESTKPKHQHDDQYISPFIPISEFKPSDDLMKRLKRGFKIQPMQDPFFDVYLNPKYFNIALHTAPADMDDLSFIKHCQAKNITSQQRKNDEYIKLHTQIKNAIRAKLHSQLDASDTVNQITLDDFQFAVKNERKTLSSGATDADVARWEELYKVYVQPVGSLAQDPESL